MPGPFGHRRPGPRRQWAHARLCRAHARGRALPAPDRGAQDDGPPRRPLRLRESWRRAPRRCRRHRHLRPRRNHRPSDLRRSRAAGRGYPSRDGERRGGVGRVALDRRSPGTRAPPRLAPPFPSTRRNLHAPVRGTQRWIHRVCGTHVAAGPLTDFSIFIRRCSPAVTGGWRGGRSGPMHVGRHSMRASGLQFAK